MAEGTTYAIKLLMRIGSIECRPGFYLLEGSGGGPELGTLRAAQDVVSALGDGTFGPWGGGVVYYGVEAQDVDPGAEVTWQEIIDAQPSDSTETSPLPPSDAALISITTATKGVKGNYAQSGRMYLPPLPAGTQISGFWTSDATTPMSVFAAILRDRYIDDATAYQLRCVSFSPGTKPRVMRNSQTATGLVVRNIVASCNFRRPGRGI